MKKIFKLLCVSFILVCSIAALGCGSISESDLPDKSEEFATELLENSIYVKPKDMPCVPRYEAAFKNANILLSKLKPEVKEAILSETLKPIEVVKYKPVNLPSGHIMIPMSIKFEAYMKKYPKFKNTGSADVAVYWQKVDDKWLVADIKTGRKSNLDDLESLQFNLLDVAERAMRIQEKARINS